MSSEKKIELSAAIGGVLKSAIYQIEADHPNPYEDIPLAAGAAAADWVKSDEDTAACNLSAGHGFSSGKFDVYWTGGCRYDVDGTVTENALALDGGEGADFPESEAEDVVVCPHQQINTSIDGDQVKAFFALADRRCHLHFEDAEGNAIDDLELQNGLPYLWVAAWKRDNYMTGAPITVCYVSCGETEAGELTILSAEDATP